MLNPVAAREQIVKWASDKNRAVRYERLKKLPVALATMAFGMVRKTAEGKSFPSSNTSYYAEQKLATEQAEAFLRNGKARAAIFKAAFPTMAKELELGVQKILELSYQTGYLRRPMRAKDRPELYAEKLKAYFSFFLEEVGVYSDDQVSVEWVAQWSFHINSYRTYQSPMLAGVIDAGGPLGDSILEIMKDAAANRHDIAGPGRYAFVGLMASKRPEAWEFVEKVLLAAQRQEGLRQMILEAVDESQPEAFIRMVKLILSQDLIRFAAVARAAGVWFGESQSVEEPKRLKATLTTSLEYLTDAKAREAAITKGDASSVYHALWTQAYYDAPAAAERATKMLGEKDPLRRLGVVKLLCEIDLPETTAPILKCLQDPDPMILSLALGQLGYGNVATEAKKQKKIFETLEKLVDMIPEQEKEFKSPVEGWHIPNLSRERLADLLLEFLGDRPAERLLPYLSMFRGYTRLRALRLICEPRVLSQKVRETLLTIAGEPSKDIREAAIGFLAKCKLAEDEVQTIEGYLTSKMADFRRSIFSLLLNRTDSQAIGSMERLLAKGDANCRAGGIELARRMVDADRQAETVRSKLVAYQEARGGRLSDLEKTTIAVILDPSLKPPTLADGLGLYNPNHRSPVKPPVDRGTLLASPATKAFLESLDNLIHENRMKTFTVKSGEVVNERILGQTSYSWDSTIPNPDYKLSAEEDQKNLPLLSLWETWWKKRGPETRDDDGFELLRAFEYPILYVREGEENREEVVVDDDDDDDEDSKEFSQGRKDFNEANARLRSKPARLRYEGNVRILLMWFFKLKQPKKTADFLLEAAETLLAKVPESTIAETLRMSDMEGYKELDYHQRQALEKRNEWRGSSFNPWLAKARNLQSSVSSWTAKHDIKLFELYRWLEEPIPEATPILASSEVLIRAYNAGGATLADVAANLIGPRDFTYYSSRFDLLGDWSTFEKLKSLKSPTQESERKILQKPEIIELLANAVTRIVEIELNRGETPTDASPAATSIRSLTGMKRMLDILGSFGRQGFVQTSSWSNGHNKPAVLTHLVKVFYPTAEDTPEKFAALVKEAVKSKRFAIDRIVELGLVNPRWASHCEKAIGWPGYQEAVYWFIAHTGSSWQSELGGHVLDDNGEKQPSLWEQFVKARTSLTPEQRSDGLIDVNWFHQAYSALGKDDRWDAIEHAAKFLGYGQSHKKAARLADVLLGRTKKKELVEQIRKKYLKEAVRHLGLLPLPKDEAKRTNDVAERYAVLKEYERYARGLSSLSKEPAMESMRLGLENLAVTAGYPDPMRLEWAVTADEVSDLKEGPATLTASGVTISMGLSVYGEVEVSYARGEKPLKSLPADLRKAPKVSLFLDRKKTLTRMFSSSKKTLEQAMCAGEVFQGSELSLLMNHAIVRPMIEKLVVKTKKGLGYPVSVGTALRSHTGKSLAIKPTDEWTLAHPLDFLEAGDWPKWQAECFRSERLQPFKQVFRELYVLTKAEKEDGKFSARYSGHQVNESQAKALLASRGWSTKDDLSKIFLQADLVADISLGYGYSTPADAQSPSVESLRFHKRGEWKPVLLKDVPPIIFSETMRDLDLIVSVAHVGGVDPEATQSTVEMRAALLRETLQLLKITNVKLDPKHALIEGSYGKYGVHLGSGGVQKLPGGSLCVVAVPAGHRGRLFLPFADEDPRTSEVISKVLLLARDNEIQDPTILEQISAR
ncbi:MAG: DUF5724 domain-containing protein [Fimbriiglobus sp.]